MERADTIAAVATAAGTAGIGIVRVSGPLVCSVMEGIIGRQLSPRRASLAEFKDGHGQLLDSGIALFYPAPGSFTGEDILELQGHGGPTILRLVLRRCLELGARMAQPGEFTRRAFLNGKMDLAQAESVIDLINAGSEAAARSAMRSLSGEFSKKIRSLVDGLIEIRVQVEAGLDFPEDEINISSRPQFQDRLDSLRLQLGQMVSTAEQGRLLREGVRVVLLGRPNVGKSSLMNKLAEEEVAIVTEFPGTTRDPLRYELIIDGVPIHVVDTAGVRDSKDPVEKLGMERTWREINLADVAMVVRESGAETSEDRELAAKLPREIRRLTVLNKIDLSGQAPSVVREGTNPAVYVSAKTGAGLDLLRAALLELIGRRPAEEIGWLARERHTEALRKAHHAMSQAVDSNGLELMAEELRQAQIALSQVTGEFSSEDLLGEIFSRFCIGK